MNPLLCSVCSFETFAVPLWQPSRRQCTFWADVPMIHDLTTRSAKSMGRDQRDRDPDHSSQDNMCNARYVPTKPVTVLTNGHFHGTNWLDH